MYTTDDVTMLHNFGFFTTANDSEILGNLSVAFESFIRKHGPNTIYRPLSLPVLT